MNRDDVAPDDVDDDLPADASTSIIDFSTAQLYINELIKFGAKNNNNEIINISQKLDNLIEKCQIANASKQSSIGQFQEISMLTHVTFVLLFEVSLCYNINYFNFYQMYMYNYQPSSKITKEIKSITNSFKIKLPLLASRVLTLLTAYIIILKNMFKTQLNQKIYSVLFTILFFYIMYCFMIHKIF